MHPNDRIHEDGLVAQETVVVISTERPFRVMVGVDTAPPEQGGRHQVLFEGRAAEVLAANMAASQSLDLPLHVILEGSLAHEHHHSVITDLDTVSYQVFKIVRLRAEEIQKSAAQPYVTPGPAYPMTPDGYHTCANLGGVLDLTSLGARKFRRGMVISAMLDTGDSRTGEPHEIWFTTPALQNLIKGVREKLPANRTAVEANVKGTLYSLNGYTTVIATRVEFAIEYPFAAIAQVGARAEMR